MRVKYEDAAYILNYKKEHEFQKLFCVFTVEPRDNDGYMIACDIKIPAYIFMVIPYFVLSLFWSIWECGIVHGDYILSRRTHEYHASKYDYASERIRERCPYISTGKLL